VRSAGVRLELAAEQIAPAPATGSPPPAPKVAVEPLDADARPTRIDLRGLRVDDALAQLAKAVDDALRSGIGQLEIIHGVGTGALQKAVRKHLRELPGVSRFEAGPGQRDGTTLAFFA
jgi:DNA mismatch repair protein MutS2